MLRIALEFDGVVVEPPLLFSDTTTPLQFIPGAKQGLLCLRRAGHILLLYSMRANRALREDRLLDPLVQTGAVRVDPAVWLTNRPIHEARYAQMLRFVDEKLPGVFDAVDDGRQGKPNVDLTIDDRTIGLVPGAGWGRLVHLYGEKK